MLNLDSAAFRAWLKAQPADAEVGKVCDSYRCPLARWYGSQGEAVEVNVSVLMDCEHLENHPTAPWQDAFIDAVDNFPEQIGEYAITAAAALEILARVERMEGLVQ